MVTLSYCDWNGHEPQGNRRWGPKPHWSEAIRALGSVLGPQLFNATLEGSGDWEVGRI